MPGMGGIELTRRLKADYGRSEIRIVALTAYARKGDCAKIIEAGCDGSIPKPINADTFAASVSTYLAAA